MYRLVVALVVFVGCSACQGQLADSVAVRVRVGGVCGSGSICGADSTNGYVVTNAHVSGTSVGREVQVDYVGGGEKKTTQGRIIWAAYSSQRLIDVAILAVPSLTCKEYSPMIKVPPGGAPYATRGSPRCVWPLVTKDFLRPDVSSDSPLMRGDPDAIGGQSGSGITNMDLVMVGLVTWSWGGRCAGQQTRSIWDVASSRSLLEVAERPQGLVEVGSNDDRSPTEDGIFGIATFSVPELPIWSDGIKAPCPPPVLLSLQEQQMIELMRSRSDLASSFDWVAFIKAILDLIAMFRR